MTITREQSQIILAADLARFERAVTRMCEQMTQGQFDALVSFAFNLGEANLKNSTLLKRHLAGDQKGAAAQFAVWNKARVNGKLTVLAGLTKRRAAEAELYLS